MSYIKEPKGVDFIIASEPLSDKFRKEISEFIRDYKEKTKGKKKTPTKTKSRSKSK